MKHCLPKSSNKDLKCLRKVPCHLLINFFYRPRSIFFTLRVDPSLKGLVTVIKKLDVTKVFLW